MRRGIAAALCAAVLGAAALSFVLTRQETAAQSGSPAQGPQDQASIKELMDSLIDPSADAIWNAAGSVFDQDKGLVEWAPKNDEEWRDVRRAAVRIIEGANLLMLHGREAAPPGTKSETPGVELEPAEIAALINGNRTSFDSFAEALRGIGREALQASDAKNTESLMDVGGRMQEVCESCHQAFWYPNEVIPQSGEKLPGP